jgi:hypothetical protein
MDDATRFQRLVQFRVPDSLSDTLGAAADKNLQSKSEYVRQSVLTALRADGFDPAVTPPPRDAGALYDVINGQRCYALVSGGRILTETTRLDAMPDLADAGHWPAGYAPSDGDRWLPIGFTDSEPFDPATHWRVPPYVTRIEVDRVVREFPVVPKSMEFA